ncbi:peptidylprolyl isomerase [Bombella saccharophila]|uniref:Parvulin-like PPIase n=1 Tax=Bombella saccharophila TaxID=2967338 RepID=A0ABT3W7Q8_9PROT|nr:peptidylprolyl isomerase [Bombella saccharophila]MCX5613754.1 peptidylprolyl isomerase [Bombella saccharophila]PHI97485.1 peptidylprolyl isomerase [Parasaccharibacter apium]
MRLSRSFLLCTALIGSFSSLTTQAIAADAAPAQPATKADATAQSSTTPATDPNLVLATVNDQKITLSDVQRAAATLPPEARQLQPTVIIPLLINQLIDQKAVQIQAEKEGLPEKPAVKAAMEAAAGNALQNAYLEEQVAPKLTDDALKAYYQTQYASKKPEEEVHARHILVDSEAKAQDIIRQLNKGADFAKLASRLSTDKASGGTNGGDLGWFKRGDMISAFSDAAFAMKSGSITQKPIHTQYGWHVIQVLGTRTAPVPSFEQVRDQIRRDLIRQEVRKVVENAEKQARIVHYDAKGQPITNNPAAPAPAATPANTAH